MSTEKKIIKNLRKEKWTKCVFWIEGNRCSITNNNGCPVIDPIEIQLEQVIELAKSLRGQGYKVAVKASR